MSVDRMTTNLAWLNNSPIYERPSVDHCLRLKARYGERALIETAMGRYKGMIGPRLRARSFLAQQTEAAIGSPF